MKNEGVQASGGCKPSDPNKRFWTVPHTEQKLYDNIATELLCSRILPIEVRCQMNRSLNKSLED